MDNNGAAFDRNANIDNIIDIDNTDDADNSEVCVFDGLPFEDACTRLVADTGALLTSCGAYAAAAESLTGGLISSEIVRVPGSSKWFSEGCVTYTEAAKVKRLGVSSRTLERYTAVSRQVAAEMAEGELASSGADVAVSATGLAGPGCDELGRGAGLVYIGGACRYGCVVKRLTLSGDRTQIRRQAAYQAIKLLHALTLLHKAAADSAVQQ